MVTGFFYLIMVGERDQRVTAHFGPCQTGGPAVVFFRLSYLRAQMHPQFHIHWATFRSSGGTHHG
jgi:hypothetical protein